MKQPIFKINKIPIPVAVLFFFFVLILGIFTIKQGRTVFLKASTEIVPKQIKITNVDSKSFTVSWTTISKSKGKIYFGENPALGEISKDVRDNNKADGNYLNHYVQIENLKPETKYYFKIVSSSKEYDNSGKPYEVLTGPEKTANESDIAQGKILDSNGQPAPNTIVYLALANTITQSALTDSNGIWVRPLSLARSLDLKNFSTYDRNAQIIEVFVQGEKNISNVTLSTKNDNPTPDITLGKNYNFLDDIEKNLKENIINVATVTPSQPNSFLQNSVGSNLSILYPIEKEQINSFFPEFIGTGPKIQKIDILVESNDPISDSITIDSQGKWKWTPITQLTPGEHKITISYTNKEGFLEKVTKNFTIFAMGESNLPAYTATGSGQITSSPIPTTTSIPATTPISTPTKTSTTPTIAPIATITPIVTSTKTPTAVPTSNDSRTTMPSTESGSLKSGATLPTFLLSGIGIIAIIAGFALVLF